MSEQNQEPQPLDNGAEIIKRFGGIRPMAGKIDIPVTTVQGWKKRDTIPAARRELVLEAAKEQGINLVDLVPDLEPGADKSYDEQLEKSSARKERAGSEILGEKISGEKKEATQESDETTSDPATGQPGGQKTTPEDKSGDRTDHLSTRLNPAGGSTSVRRADISAEPQTSQNQQRTASDQSQPNHAGGNQASKSEERYVTMDEMDEKMREIQKKSLKRSLIGAAALVVVIAGAAAFLLWPAADKTRSTVEKNSARLVSLEKDVSNLDQKLDEAQGKRGAFFGGIIPEKVNKRLEELGLSTKEIRDKVTNLSSQASQMAEDFAGQGTSPDLQARLKRLEARFSEFAGLASLQDLMTTLTAYRASPQGRVRLQEAVSRLETLLGQSVSASSQEGEQEGTKGDSADMQELLKKEKGKDTELGQALEGVDNDNLQAAAMLLAFTQVRSSLNRDNESFKSDLDILRSLVREDDKDLKQALDRLSPKAEKGILTPKGLSDQLRSLSGEIVAASLKGEDVSISEKAKARMNEIVSIEKNDELVSGNQTQKQIDKAQDLLDEGKVPEALKVLESLEPESQDAASPVIEQLKARLDAKAVEDMLKQNIASRLTGPAGGVGGNKGKMMVDRIVKEIEVLTSPGVFTDPESGYSILPRN